MDTCVCASRLTGGTHICAGPGASCVPVHPCRALPRLGSRTTGSGWFPEMQTGLPEQLRTDSKSAGPPEDGVSTPLEVLLETALGCPVEHSWDVDGTKGPQMLLTPEEEVAGELRHATGA